MVSIVVVDKPCMMVNVLSGFLPKLYQQCHAGFFHQQSALRFEGETLQGDEHFFLCVKLRAFNPQP